MANSTMKRQNRSVIMSAKDTSQRSSFSCSSSWAWRLCRREAMGLRRRLLGAAGGRLVGVGRPLGRRDEGHELLRDDPRVVARLDGEDALEGHGAEVQL